MIPLEKQCVSLELARRLKELGVKQESLWYWQWNCVAAKYFLHTRKQVDDSVYPYEHYFSAFTVAELGERLPGDIVQFTPQGYKMNRLLKFWKLPYKFCGRIGEFDDDIPCFDFSADTEADARAKMLIYLLENKLV